MHLRLGLFLIGFFGIQTPSNASFHHVEKALKIHQIAIGLSWRHQQDIGVTFAKSFGESQEVIDSICSIYQMKMRHLDSLKDAFNGGRSVLRLDTFFIQYELNQAISHFAGNLERNDINALSDYMQQYPYYQPKPLRYNKQPIYLAPITIYFLDEYKTSPVDYSDQDLVWIDFLISNYRPLRVTR